MHRFFYLSLATVITTSTAAPAKSPKHCIFIVADDLGHNDVSFHGSKQVPTPHIDALAARGTMLDSYYAASVCSPSRSMILSGRHIIHTGIFSPFPEASADHLNLSYSLLPTFLSRATTLPPGVQITSHLSGKYHLGGNVNASIPTSRGFNSHLGYLFGAENYLSHIDGPGTGAYDFFDDLRPAIELNNTWSPYPLVDRATALIANASDTNRLFLYLAFQNVHWPIMAPQKFLDRFVNSTGGNTVRQTICALIAFLDEAIGNVTAALDASAIADDTLIVFISDNGGPTNGDEGTQSNNFPLRGGKNSLWEGGNRLTALVAGAGITARGHSPTLIHATDWVPTLVKALTGEDMAGVMPPGEPPFLPPAAYDVWEALSTGTHGPRTSVLLETHPAAAAPGDRAHGDAMIVGDMKVVRWDSDNRPEENGWFLPPGQALGTTTYTVQCSQEGSYKSGPAPAKQCSKEYCLFNITEDPCEYNDLAAAHPEMVTALVAQLEALQQYAVSPAQPRGCTPIKVPVGNSGALAWKPCDQ